MALDISASFCTRICRSWRHPDSESLEERWLYEALTESYLPLLAVIDGWRRDGVGYALTLPSRRR